MGGTQSQNLDENERLLVVNELKRALAKVPRYKGHYNVSGSNLYIGSRFGGKRPIHLIWKDGKSYKFLAQRNNLFKFNDNQLLYLVDELTKNPRETEIVIPKKPKITDVQKQQILKAKEVREAQETAQTAQEEAQEPPGTPGTPGSQTRSLQGVSQNEGAPNGLLGDVPTGTFEQISNAFGDVHTIGYGGSGATF